MTDMNQTFDMPSEKKSLPTGINVLTILTFIGCGFGALFTLCMSWLFKFFLRMMDKAVEAGNVPESKLAEMEKQRPKIELMLNNVLPLMLISLAGIALCFYGALQMRKLKKEGFYVYVLGQVLPIIGTGLLVGFATQFSGGGSYVFGLAIPLLFIILYAGQLKHMK